MLFASTEAGPIFPTAKFATGVTVVVTGGVTLFVGTGSGVGEPTLAKFVSEPVAGEVTVTVIFVDCVARSVPKLHVTRPLLFTPLPLAADGPRFVTEMV